MLANNTADVAALTSEQSGSGENASTSSLPDSAAENSHCQKRAALIHFSELPSWYKDNPDIHYGYRPVSGSAKACFRSWFYLHNETLNIWTHLMPSLLFIPLAACLQTYIKITYPDTDAIDQLVFTFFFVSAIVCFTLSTLFHTLINCSEKIYDRFQHLDFLGILIFNQGLALSGVFYILYEERILRSVYIGVVCFDPHSCALGYLCLFLVSKADMASVQIFMLGIFSILVVLNPKFQGVKWRILRLVVFLSCGLSPTVPVIHASIKFGGEKMMSLGLGYYIGEAALFLFGAALYGVRSNPILDITLGLMTRHRVAVRNLCDGFAPASSTSWERRTRFSMF